MKGFDDIFRENVEKAFGSYDAGHLADEGWNSFVARQKAAGRRTLIIPLWAKAASVAILIGAGGYFAYKMFSGQPQTETLIQSSSLVESKTEDLPPALTSEPGAAVSHTLPVSVRPAARISSAQPEEIADKTEAVPDVIVREPVTGKIYINLPDLAYNFPPADSESLSLHGTDELKEVSPDGNAFNDEAGAATKKDKISLLAGFSGLLAQSDEAASAAPGVSVGLYLDRKLSRRISLRPGLALSRQSLGLENSNGITEFNYSVPLSDGTSGTVDSYSGQLDMLAIEVPVNLVFNIIERRNSGIYISAGASAQIYLNQEFSADFVNEYTKETYSTMSASSTFETRYTTVEVQNSYAAFSRVDLFNLVSLSAGYFLPYNKTGLIIIEPFVRLPLADLTSLDMKVRYAGISFKMSFGTH
ncbi:MAG TPA: outer membrane beta-barrel protein [Bacteroidales bacterium]|nr:outer membrane beta-barrel protein [Bacteroidales bacterium]HPF03549.1 outer membrane beta-barrel protein [Bacteroidales bacterium]HPJ58766.1 outer membrane beta-barrel protein [Bacteroidales bacterium]HPR11916.1 outer membrane beta-barrel protein [Bacteroidales bacterium]HRW85385.1 outer membrane beta-barrel protein [Bacteroidales bacterium]